MKGRKRSFQIELPQINPGEDCSSCGAADSVHWRTERGWLYWRCYVCGLGRVIGRAG
jgi:hypothetical protein